MNGSASVFPLVAVRCPCCNRLAARVSGGAQIEVKCARCKATFRIATTAAGGGR